MYEDLDNLKLMHLWFRPEKLTWWGDGEWVNEADKATFEYKGYFCKVDRIISEEGSRDIPSRFGGHLCGYVRIPKDHPLFEKNVFELDDGLNISVHGGLTFGRMVEEEWWIGFDCAHSDDYQPSIEHRMKTDPELMDFRKKFPKPERLKDLSFFNPVYRNIDYVIYEIKGMVDQLIAIKEKELTHITEGRDNVQFGETLNE